jgi:hypothetical protein
MVDMADIEHRHGSYSSRMNFRIVCAAGLAACIAAWAHAGEIRVGGGVGLVHKPGMAMASAAVGPASFLAWDNHNYGLGLAYSLEPRPGWEAGIGGFVARRTDDDTACPRIRRA